MTGRETTGFAERVQNREATVAIVGLGYVGLPLAMAFAAGGAAHHRPRRRRGPGRRPSRPGASHVDDVPDADAARPPSSSRRPPTPPPCAKADAIFLCVPTPFDAAKTPVLDFVRGAAATVGAGLVAGQLVILQSTTYPGTTTEIVQPILEAGERPPRRRRLPPRLLPRARRPRQHHVDAGQHARRSAAASRPTCGEMTRVLLAAMLDDPSLVTVVSSPKVAEMSKLAENTYRAVNIAYVNELAMLAHEMDVDIWEVMEAAATKPFGFQPFLPGIGPGGQCIPVNPYYISWKAREFDFHTSFIELAGDINLRMTNYVMHRIHSFTTRLGIVAQRRACAVPRRRVQGRRERRPQLARGAGDGAARSTRARDVELRRSARRRRSRSAARAQDAVAARRRRRSSGYDLVVVLVRNPAWPVDAILASGVPTFDAVNALDTPSERLARTVVSDPASRSASSGSSRGSVRAARNGCWSSTPRGGDRDRVHVRGRVRPRLEAAPRARARGARRAHALPRRAAPSSIRVGSTRLAASAAPRALRRRARALAARRRRSRGS